MQLVAMQQKGYGSANSSGYYGRCVEAQAT